MTVTAGNEIRTRLLEEYQRQVGKGGWRAVAAVFDISAGMAFRVAVQGYVPRDGAIRRKLGFPFLGEVEFVGGESQVASGKSQVASRKMQVQALGSDLCVECGQPFVSNHPRRRKCFGCSPYRGVRGG